MAQDHITVTIDAKLRCWFWPVMYTLMPYWMLRGTIERDPIYKFLCRHAFKVTCR